MIKNDRQFRILKARKERLQKLSDDLSGADERAGQDDAAMEQLKLAAVNGELTLLEHELDEYLALKAGDAPIGAASTFDDVANLLVRARIARGMTQAQLAESLGLKEQQIQRYEATGYESASLGRLREVARELDIDLNGDLGETEIRPARILIAALEGIGLSRDLIQTRIAPAAIISGRDDAASVLNLTARIARVFGLRGGSSEALSAWLRGAASAAAFKTSGTAKLAKLEGYAAYAHYLALQTLIGTSYLPAPSLPGTAEELRAHIMKCGAMDFPNALQTAWAFGIPVIPLADPGAFHAAYWRHKGRGVIVLKQARRLPAIWLFDLLHEMKHAIDEPEIPEREAIEIDATDRGRRDSPEEVAANDFAASVIFGVDPDALFHLVWEKSRHEIALVKRAVSLVARKEGLNEGALAYFAAYRLALEGLDWWAAATSMQEVRTDPWEIARDVYLQNVRLDQLETIDRDLVLRALIDRTDLTELSARGNGS